MNIVLNSKMLRNLSLINLDLQSILNLSFLGEKSINYETNIGLIHLSNCRLDFYHEKKRINSCDDISKSNISSVMYIFQINLNGLFILRNVDYKESKSTINKESNGLDSGIMA
jgi:hypothetical protein